MSFSSPDVENEIILVGRSNVGKSAIARELIGKKFTVGKRPGVTLEPNHWIENNFVLTDMPGFGFMEGIDEQRREKIKDNIVRYIEKRKNKILLAIHVIDANSFVEIVDRWEKRGDIPHDIDLHEFLLDLEIKTVVAVNKIDKVDNKDKTLDKIGERLGYLPPWKQWKDTLVPISAKRGSTQKLKDCIRKQLEKQNKNQLYKHIN